MAGEYSRYLLVFGNLSTTGSCGIWGPLSTETKHFSYTLPIVLSPRQGAGSGKRAVLFVQEQLLEGCLQRLCQCPESQRKRRCDFMQYSFLFSPPHFTLENNSSWPHLDLHRAFAPWYFIRGKCCGSGEGGICVTPLMLLGQPKLLLLLLFPLSISLVSDVLPLVPFFPVLLGHILLVCRVTVLSDRGAGAV